MTDNTPVPVQTMSLADRHPILREENWNRLEQIAARFAGSTLVPPDFINKPGNCFVALMAGMPLGLSPLACLQSIAVINGRPTLFGDAPIAQILAHPELENISEKRTGSIKGKDLEITITVTRKRANGAVMTTERSYSVEMAERAKLWGKAGPWTNYPERMIFNRARAFALRDSFADVLQGVSIAADAYSDADTERVTIAPITIEDANEETQIEQSDGYAQEAEAQADKPAEPKAKPKDSKKKKTKEPAKKKGEDDKPEDPPAEEAAPEEAEAAPAEFHPMPLTQGHEILTVGDMKDPESVGAVRFDLGLGGVQQWDGSTWHEHPKPDDVLKFCVTDLAQRITAFCKTSKMDRKAAMEWAKDSLELKELPDSFLTMPIEHLLKLAAEI